jgi:hypothetical protein
LHNRNRRRGLEPSRKLKARILGLENPLTLDELFVDGPDGGNLVLDHLRKVARLKVIGVFRVAGAVDRSNRSAGDSYALPGDGTPEQLASAIARLMKGSHDFVRASDLSPAYRNLAKQWLDTLRAHARHLLVLEVVRELHSAGVQLWYFSGDEEWLVAQSLIDEYEGLLRDVRSLPGPKHRFKRDDRMWHGRPSCHRGRVLEGTSVGYAA